MSSTECYDPTDEQASAAGALIILGNLQVGKTTLFRKLCGPKFEDVNVPESSLCLSKGTLGRGEIELYDTPGTATLFAQGVDEAVTRDAVLSLDPTTLLVVADAKNMRRSLALIVHAAELGLPMVVAVNMEDEALRHGTEVDTERLARLLGVEVIPTVAVDDRGIGALRRALREPRVPRRLARFSDTVEELLEDLSARLEELPSPRAVALALLAGDLGAERLVKNVAGEEAFKEMEARVLALRGSAPLPLEVVLTDELYDAADRVVDQVVHHRPRRRTYLDMVGRWAQHPVWGLFIAAAVITAMYYWVGALGATLVVDTLSEHLFDGLLLPLCNSAVAYIPWEIARDALMDEDFGLIPSGLFLAFGLVLPVLFFFYFFFELLQNSGYLPRLSVLLDRLMRKIGLNGRGVLPLVMGFSCVTMALITTRMLETRKERIIASLLLMLGMPCAPMLSVMLIILADLPVSASFTVFGIIAVQSLLAGVLANKLLPGGPTDLVMVIPDMRASSINDVLLLTVRRTYFFMREAVPFFLLASFVLFIADRLGVLLFLEDVSRPVVRGLLGLPDDSVRVFIKTMIRRENGVAELSAVKDGFTNVQLVTTLLVMTFLTPCVNAILVLIKERGLARSALLVLAVSTYAVATGTLVSHACRWLGVTFT